jgi:hypothetical protein
MEGGTRKVKMEGSPSIADSETTPCKFRKVKMEGSTSNADSEEAPMATISKPISCNGCMRHSDKHMSFYDPEQPIEWAAESSRGGWCNDCHNLWRNCERSTRTLVLYALHLETAWEHRQRHVQLLISYISLKIEGNKRITREVIESRRNLLNSIFDLMGVPFGPFVVGPRSDDKTDPNKFLCMYQDEDGGPFSLRSLSAFPLIKTAANLFCAPVTRMQPVVPVFIVDATNDQDWLRSMAVPEAKEEATGSSSADAAVKEEAGQDTGDNGEDQDPHFLSVTPIGLSASEVRIWTKGNAAFLSTKTTFEHILGVDVESATFSTDVQKLLKSLIHKLNRTRNDMVSVPFKRYLVELDQMIAACVSARAFCFELVIYFKKFSNLNAVHEAGQDMWSWMDKVQTRAKMGLTMELVVFKSQVHSLFADTKSISKAIDIIVGPQTSKLHTEFKDSPTYEESDFVDLVHNMLLDGVRTMCAAFGEQPDPKEVCPAVAADFEKLLPFLQGSSTYRV